MFIKFIATLVMLMELSGMIFYLHFKKEEIDNRVLVLRFVVATLVILPCLKVLNLI